jgi:ABC-type phosphate/phosphonate transport system substrate-binding protein
MCGPGGGLFGGGGGSSTSSTTSSTTNSSTQVSTTSNVSVPISVPISFDTHDLSEAIAALAQGNVASAALGAGATIGAAKAGATGQVIAAQIAAHAGPSWSTIIIVGGSIVGLLITLHVIKLRGSK